MIEHEQSEIFGCDCCGDLEQTARFTLKPDVVPRLPVNLCATCLEKARALLQPVPDGAAWAMYRRADGSIVSAAQFYREGEYQRIIIDAKGNGGIISEDVWRMLENIELIEPEEELLAALNAPAETAKYKGERNV